MARAEAANDTIPTRLDVIGSALATGVLDVSPTLSETLGEAGVARASATAIASAPPSTTGSLPSTVVIFNFRVVLRLP